MTDTANLGLPCIEGSQAQKHVTHNEALRILDTVVQLAVDDRDLTAPPGSPADGARFIVKAGATGAWAGRDNDIAAWQDGAWQFSTPKPGWLAYVIDEGALLAWSGGAWIDAISALSSLNNMTLLGVGTTADAANPLSAKLNNALFAARTAAEGGDGDLRYKLSKESAAQTLSFLFQDNYSGRAEIGLTGDDDFHFKVSPDGAAWHDAIVIDRNTGQVSFPQGGASSDLELTLAELSLGVADALNTAQFFGVSGNRFADSFDALTYVDIGAATNLDTGTAGLIKPSSTGGTFASTYDPTLSGNSTGFGGAMDRFVFAAAAFSVDGDRVRLTLAPPSSGNNTIISNVFIGPKGAAAPNFDGTQVRVTFGGNNGVTLAAGGSVVVSDDVALAFDHTKDHVVAIEFTGTSDVRGIFGGAGNVTRHEKIGSGESGTTSVSGYVPAAGYLGVIDKIEVRTTPGSTSNCAVASTALTAASAPSTAKLVARVKEIDSIALNTDLVFSASRNGGANYAAFTMTRKYTANAIAVYESNQLDISVLPSGMSMKWKLSSANNKKFELHDLYFYWS